jgi:hypothetical protein
MKQLKTYLVQERSPSTQYDGVMVDALTPTEAAEQHAIDLVQRMGVKVAPDQLWVRLARKGSKWAMYRIENGKATRAKSLRVGGEA